MRPAGVWERQKQLRAEQDLHDSEHPESALRLALTWLVHESALLAFADLSTSRVVETYRVVLAHLDDPAQVRTGSALEAASLECVTRLRAPLAALAVRAEPDATRDEVIAHGPLLQIPAVALMGHSMPDAYFPMVCWNAAGSRQDGVISPYRAASMITYAGYYKPAEEPDLLAAMHELRERYEDSPDSRPAVAAEITAVLGDWLARRSVR